MIDPLELIALLRREHRIRALMAAVGARPASEPIVTLTPDVAERLRKMTIVTDAVRPKEPGK